MRQPKPDSMDYPELLAQVESGVIKIPDFQRPIVWDIGQTLYLLDSISRGYPIGSLILWRTEDRMKSHRNVGGLSLREAPEGRELNYVLDGQQRLTSLFACLKGATIAGKPYRVYCDLDSRDDSEIFSLSQSDRARFADLKDVLGDSPHLVYDTLTPDRKKRFNELRESFRLYKFPVIRIEDQPLDTVCEIFTRINNSGTELDLFDLMVAKTWKDGFNLRDRYNELVASLEGVQFEGLGSSAVMQAVSCVIKGACTRKVTLSIRRDEMATGWDESSKAILHAIDFIRDHLGVPSSRLMPYPSAVAPIAFFFHRNGFKQPDARLSKLLSRYFWRSAAIGRYTQGTESKLGLDLKEVDKAMSGDDKSFTYPEGWTAVDYETISRTELSLSNAFCKTVLAFLAAQHPLSLENNTPVRVDNSSLARSNSRHFHHFFPKKHLERKGVSQEMANRVANICLVPAQSNLHYQDKAPRDYLAPLRISNPGLSGALRSHLIEDSPEFGIGADDYSKFLEARGEEIKSGLHSLVLTDQEFDDLYGAGNEEFPSDGRD